MITYYRPKLISPLQMELRRKERVRGSYAAEIITGCLIFFFLLRGPQTDQDDSCIPPAAGERR
jgi:hypothetical protein